MTITIRPRWSLGRGKTLVPSRWQATWWSTPATDPANTPLDHVARAKPQQPRAAAVCEDSHRLWQLPGLDPV